jgi:FO synthase
MTARTLIFQADALALADINDTAALMAQAAWLRDAHHGGVVTYSRKVFIPLTQLCRDSCHYCTFARPPRRGAAAYMAPDEVLAVARAGAAAGCTEALFTLGDKPELRYAAARSALAALGTGDGQGGDPDGDQGGDPGDGQGGGPDGDQGGGQRAAYSSTIDYLRAMAERVVRETDLLPHLNPGVMSRDDMAKLRPVSASMGLMLESAADRLSARGGPHFGSPDKRPAVRLATIRQAGELSIPFTTGLLIGIGETRRERIEALLALRHLHDAHGHIQEVIIQPFRAKPGTRMAHHPDAPDDELLWTLAVARIVLGGAMNVQTPPNLVPGRLRDAIAAGINDWGGISPVTPDFVNPEAPWPHVEALAAEMAACGRMLLPRLPLYPDYARDAARWLDPAMRGAVLRASDAQGLARDDAWSPGQTAVPISAHSRESGNPDGRCRMSDGGPPIYHVRHGSPLSRGRADDRPQVHSHGSTGNGALDCIFAKTERGEALAEDEIVALFAARGADFEEVCAAADRLRAATVGDTVTYVVNRNINYTNVCSYRCAFCAFSKGKSAEHLRGAAYDLDHDEIARRTVEAWARGATEVCLQGGIHPAYTGDTYLTILRTVKSVVPQIHVHAFSPLEVRHGAATLGIPVRRFLERLRDAGLGTLPGTAAEILDDGVRAVICPDKLTTGEWLDTVETAHSVGLATTATIMFGHVEGLDHWARHLLAVRDLAARTSGITEFVPLPFVHMEAPIYYKSGARRGPTFREAVLMHAVARLALHPLIRHIQVSWVKMGGDGAGACLRAGCDDLGGTLMNESISRAAGAAHGEEFPPDEMEALIAGLGRGAAQRTTLYRAVPSERREASLAAAALAPPVQTPATAHRRRAAATAAPNAPASG